MASRGGNRCFELNHGIFNLDKMAVCTRRITFKNGVTIEAGEKFENHGQASFATKKACFDPVNMPRAKSTTTFKNGKTIEAGQRVDNHGQGAVVEKKGWFKEGGANEKRTRKRKKKQEMRSSAKRSCVGITEMAAMP